MPGKILGIDIDSDSVTVVQVEGGLRGYSLTGCGRVMIEEDGGLDGGLAALVEQVDLKADISIGSIPAENISYRNLQMPFRDTKKIRQAIVYTVETMVPFPIEDLIVDFTIVDQRDQSEILAAMVRRSYISHYLGSLQEHGVDPDLLDIRGVPVVLWLLKQDGTPDDGLLLEMGSKRNTLVLFLNRHIGLIRTFPLGNSPVDQEIANEKSEHHEGIQVAKRIESHLSSFCANVQTTLHAFGCQNNKEVRPERIFLTGVGSLYPNTEGILERFLSLPVERLNVASEAGVRIDESIAQAWNPAIMDNALTLALRDNRQGLGFNFRRDEFEIRGRYFGLKKVIRNAFAFLVIILLLLSSNLGIEYYSLKKRYQILDERIMEIFRQTVPEVKRIVDPVQQMKVKINEMKTSDISLPGISGGQKVLELLRDISLRISGSLDVKVLSMVIDPEIVHIKGETDSFNTVDIIKKGLETSKYFSEVTISSANLDRSGQRVQFEVKLKRKR